MPRVPTNRQADIKRAIAALKAFGLGVARIDFPVGGGFSVVPGPLKPDAGGSQADELAAWREQRARRSSQGA